MKAFMKKGILFLLLAGAVTANAQSLKDALYSGKLKTDSNTVIRKGDDLSAKIDTATKKPEATEKAKIAAVPGDPSVKKIDAQGDSVTTGLETTSTVTNDSQAISATDAKAAVAPVKNNNKIWKEYIDSLVTALKTEVLPSKKIKKDIYYLYVEYEIDTNGQVTTTNVISTPENSFLADQVKSRLIVSAPQLTPALDSANKPRKVKRKYNFNITKE
jgi:hypothetical protein